MTIMLTLSQLLASFLVGVNLVLVARNRQHQKRMVDLTNQLEAQTEAMRQKNEALKQQSLDLRASYQLELMKLNGQMQPQHLKDRPDLIDYMLNRGKEPTKH
jgi:hypothetical protein